MKVGAEINIHPAGALKTKERGLEMNKPELIEKVAEKAGLSKKDSEKAVGVVVEAIEESLARDEKVQLVGFGTFETKTRQAREGRNPATGEKIKIETSKVPAFKPGKALKDKVK